MNLLPKPRYQFRLQVSYRVATSEKSLHSFENHLSKTFLVKIMLKFSYRHSKLRHIIHGGYLGKRRALALQIAFLGGSSKLQ